MSKVILQPTDVISKTVIDACAAAGACDEGLIWAKKGRTYAELTSAGFADWMASNCPVVEVLELLSKDIDTVVRRFVAENVNTSVKVLEMLSKDIDAVVRGYVAANVKTPAAVLELLSKDIDAVVRWLVAANVNTSASAKLEGE